MHKCYKYKTELSISAKTCPQCGEVDPFLRERWDMEKRKYPKYLDEYLKKEGFSLRGGIIVVAFLLYGVWVAITNVGSPSWGDIILAACLILFPSLYIASFVQVYRNYKNYLKEREQELDRLNKQIVELVGKDDHYRIY